jgi:hypothetical protein
MTKTRAKWKRIAIVLTLAGDITEEEVRARVEQREEVFFIDAARKYGKVQIADGNLVFVRGY